MNRRIEETPPEELMEDNMKINIDEVKVLKVRTDGGDF
jgi:hypothetical protein